MLAINECYGKFEVGDDFLQYEPETLSSMFSQLGFIPLRMERVQYKIKYYGLSPLFRSVIIGEIVPFYKITLTKTEGGHRVIVEEIKE